MFVFVPVFLSVPVFPFLLGLRRVFFCSAFFFPFFFFFSIVPVGCPIFLFHFCLFIVRLMFPRALSLSRRDQVLRVFPESCEVRQCLQVRRLHEYRGQQRVRKRGEERSTAGGKGRGRGEEINKEEGRGRGGGENVARKEK